MGGSPTTALHYAMPPPPLRTAYAAGTLTTIGYLLVQLSAAKQAATDARRAAKRTNDLDAADALNAAADALDASVCIGHSVLSLARVVVEDLTVRRQ